MPLLKSELQTPEGNNEEAHRHALKIHQSQSTTSNLTPISQLHSLFFEYLV